MKLLLVGLGIFFGGYLYMLSHTMDIVTDQTQHLAATYQYVADNSDRIATGR